MRYAIFVTSWLPVHRPESFGKHFMELPGYRYTCEMMKKLRFRWLAINRDSTH